jgi:hypothetical protein
MLPHASLLFCKIKATNDTLFISISICQITGKIFKNANAFEQEIKKFHEKNIVLLNEFYIQQTENISPQFIHTRTKKICKLMENCLSGLILVEYGMITKSYR